MDPGGGSVTPVVGNGSATLTPLETAVLRIGVGSGGSLVGTGVEGSVAPEATWRAERTGEHDEIASA